MARMKGKEVNGVILDRLDCDGTLWEMIEQAEKFLKEHINFMGFRTSKSFQRVDKFDIPIKALRELIINALIHRDYETTADVRVFVFDDRIEIINPGTFPKGVTPKKPLHKPVNNLLSQYMYDIGFIEKYGSGIVGVRSLLKENGNRELRYVLSKIETRAVTYSQVGERVGERVGEKLTGNQEKIIRLISEKREVSARELSAEVGISSRKVEENIFKLKKKGMLKRIGSARGGYWEIKKG
jgi:ATP-dependent DNA helicase RecG